MPWKRVEVFDEMVQNKRLAPVAGCKGPRHVRHHLPDRSRGVAEASGRMKYPPGHLFYDTGLVSKCHRLVQKQLVRFERSAAQTRGVASGCNHVSSTQTRSHGPSVFPQMRNPWVV